MTPEPHDSLHIARQVLETEAQAILGLIPQLSESFVRAVDVLHDCQGRVIVSGMGKSGIISHKIAATLSSTGTSAFFLHPAEAIHGDLGAVRKFIEGTRHLFKGACGNRHVDFIAHKPADD